MSKNSVLFILGCARTAPSADEACSWADPFLPPHILLHALGDGPRTFHLFSELPHDCQGEVLANAPMMVGVCLSLTCKRLYNHSARPKVDMRHFAIQAAQEGSSALVKWIFSSSYDGGLHFNSFIASRPFWEIAAERDDVSTLEALANLQSTTHTLDNADFLTRLWNGEEAQGRGCALSKAALGEPSSRDWAVIAAAHTGSERALRYLNGLMGEAFPVWAVAVGFMQANNIEGLSSAPCIQVLQQSLLFGLFKQIVKKSFDEPKHPLTLEMFTFLVERVFDVHKKRSHVIEILVKASARCSECEDFAAILAYSVQATSLIVTQELLLTSIRAPGNFSHLCLNYPSAFPQAGRHFWSRVAQKALLSGSYEVLDNVVANYGVLLAGLPLRLNGSKGTRRAVRELHARGYPLLQIYNFRMCLSFFDVPTLELLEAAGWTPTEEDLRLVACIYNYIDSKTRLPQDGFPTLKEYKERLSWMLQRVSLGRAASAKLLIDARMQGMEELLKALLPPVCPADIIECLSGDENLKYLSFSFKGLLPQNFETFVQFCARTREPVDTFAVILFGAPPPPSDLLVRFFRALPPRHQTDVAFIHERLELLKPYGPFPGEPIYLAALALPCWKDHWDYLLAQGCRPSSAERDTFRKAALLEAQRLQQERQADPKAQIPYPALVAHWLRFNLGSDK